MEASKIKLALKGYHRQDLNKRANLGADSRCDLAGVACRGIITVIHRADPRFGRYEVLLARGT